MKARKLVRMDAELTRRGRLSAMLLAAAIVVPVLAVAGMLTLRHFVWVHYPTRTLALWLLLDGAVLAVGLIVRESETVPAKVRPRRMR